MSALKLEPRGRETADKVSNWDGMSGSVAVMVNVRLVSSLTVWAPGTTISGALLTSKTVSVIVSESASEPSNTVMISR